MRVGHALVLGDDLPLPAQLPLGGQQPLNTNGAPGMDAARRDAYLHKRRAMSLKKALRGRRNIETNQHNLQAGTHPSLLQHATVTYLTSAPRPNRNPSEKRVDALWNTQALSTARINSSALAWSSVTMHSVWLLPCLSGDVQGMTLLVYTSNPIPGNSRPWYPDNTALADFSSHGTIHNR